MDQIKTTTETIITKGNDAWEDLGDITLYRSQCPNTSGKLLFKMVPSLGKRFKVIYQNKTYSLEKNTNSNFVNCNARIGVLNCYLFVEGFE